MRQIWKTMVVLALGCGLMAGAIPSAGAATVQDTIQGFKFNPTPLTITVGDSVTWTNQDTAPHTATSDTPGVFDTGMLQKGDSKTLTFNQPGTFTYHCSVHPNMHATLIVQAAGSNGTPLSASPIGLPAFQIGLANQASGLSWMGYASGRQVPYLVTDASSKSQAASMRANFAPSLARTNHLSRIYLVSGRAAPGQLAVLPAGPGTAAYSPLRGEIIVRWQSNRTPVLLTGEAQIKSLAKRGDLTLRVTGTVLNAPVVPSGS